jgi:signal recognition particle receptor subunit beta
MASINRLKRELLFKIVFYGPGLGGKTTTLQHVHSSTKPENRGNMVSLATDTDRTLYFDYLPVKLLQLGDTTVKLQLYTVPGQVYYAATRKLVLSGADGIVFVADTQNERMDSNLESLDDLNANLAEQGRKLSSIPHVFQWNKRDLPNVVNLDELDRRFNLFGAPSLATVATRGEGVFEVLERVTRSVIEAYRAELPSAQPKPAGIPLFLDAEEVGLAGAIRDLADSQPVRPASSQRRVGTPAPSPAVPSSVPASPHQAVSPPPLRPSPRPSPGPPPVAVPEPRERGTHPTTPAPPGMAAFSLGELWPPGDRESVHRAEQMLALRDAAGAIAACEDLLSRVLATGSVLLGGQPHARDPALVVSLLGLDGMRYLAFRSVARGVRAKREPSMREAFDCYTFATEARRALDRVAKGP